MVLGARIAGRRNHRHHSECEVVPDGLGQNSESGQQLSALGTTGTTGTTTNEVIRTTDENTEYEERAALVEEGAGVPRAWADGLARLHLASPAAGFSHERWRELIGDGGRFLDEWGNTAAALGWSPQDLFGIHPTDPETHPEALGLVPLIGGGEVVAISQISATIRDHSGRELVYLRRVGANAVALWSLE
jgi:hypothetical protein